MAEATLVSYGFKVDDLPRETSDLPLARDKTLQLIAAGTPHFFLNHLNCIIN